MRKAYAYVAPRHDPPVRTTIHRLRTFLAPYGEFVRVSESGYSLTVPLHLEGTLPEQPKHAPLWDRDEAPVLSSRSAPAVTIKKPRHEDVVLDRLNELQQATVTELARSLDASVSTVLRALRQLVKERRVVRIRRSFFQSENAITMASFNASRPALVPTATAAPVTVPTTTPPRGVNGALAAAPVIVPVPTPSLVAT